MQKKNEKTTPLKGEARKGTIFWLCLLFFVSAWMFVLGILVGRGTAPVHFDMEALQKELTALKEAVLQQEQKRYKIRARAADSTPELEFHEALKSTKSDNQFYSKASDALRPAAPEKRITALEKKSAPQTTRKPTGSSDKQTSASNNADAAGGDFTVQVAALKEVGVADRMVTDLKHKGFPAYRATGIVSDRGIWFRVRVGNFKTRLDAEHMLKRLEKENMKGIIVQR